MTETQRFRARLSGWWRTLTSTQRRRIVLGSVVAVSLAARDWLLLLATASLFALSEVTPTRAPIAAST